MRSIQTISWIWLSSTLTDKYGGNKMLLSRYKAEAVWESTTLFMSVPKRHRDAVFILRLVHSQALDCSGPNALSGKKPPFPALFNLFMSHLIQQSMLWLDLQGMEDIKQNS